MLQYPVQLPPLSLTSSKRAHLVRRDTSDDVQSRTFKRSPFAANDKSLSRPYHVGPLHVATSMSPSSTSSSSPPSTPSSTPFLPSKQVPRSPLVSSPRQLSSPVSRSSYLHKSNMSSFDGKSSKCSSISSVAMDVLSQGDLVGEGLTLQGEMISRVLISSSEPRADHDELAKEFEVVRRLGTGSYAVVYLVREVLSRSHSPSSDDEHGAAVAGRMEFDDGYIAHQPTEYGREYAVKVLSKANLDEEALAAQLCEAKIHQSLPAHPNIVTLHRTLETPSFLLLLLEFVPGEDLFYFLEQARDHYDVDPATTTDLSTTPPSDSSCSSSRTPSTPSLLASVASNQLLSRTRLRLIASMFSQMCEAVATCHDHSVYHRDIKPENFIVTDGWMTMPDGRRERRVIVKLTDFGLSTTDKNSADMDCGSAPYMSFECRNNLHPTYSPRAADVWSLGIVLINMLYHHNPWTDAAEGACSSFKTYRQQPVAFFMNRFTGMAQPVAEFIASNVFCILDDHWDDSKRISARAFGTWVRDLPTLLGGPSRPGHSRTVSINSVQGYRLASIPHSRRPSLRSGTPIDTVASQRVSRSMSRAPSLGPAYEVEAETEVCMLSTVPDQEIEYQEREPEQRGAVGVGIEQEPDSRSASNQKRRKRGARRGKNALLSAAAAQDDEPDSLETLARASQALAREISRNSRNGSQHSSLGGTHAPVDAPSPLSQPPIVAASDNVAAAASASSVAVSSISKKSTKWKLSFGMGSHSASTRAPSVEAPDAGRASTPAKPMPSTATRTTNLLMSLNAQDASSSIPASGSRFEQDAMGQFMNRGRRPQNHPYGAASNVSSQWGQSTTSVLSSVGNVDRRAVHSVDQHSPRTVSPVSNKRNLSPTSTRSGRPLASSASSTASSMVSRNWRSSMSSAGTSSSAFTKYSNGSSRSVSTAATSLSGGSWRSNQSNVSKYPYEKGTLPPNVKAMDGVPVELSKTPRSLNSGPSSLKYGNPTRKRLGKPKDSVLDTINERPNMKSASQTDAAISTMDLSHVVRDTERDGSSDGHGDHDGSPRKVQKGQINALAKMLSALRR
ncbi:kinase-like protein [Laetiporus sulphureus 93-53]|uniref:Kinase-like protein n=1 Tax=Laetiporus sulphureus 93-53 TaxID=1314785 RepID=A0A165F4Y2_9APHY|nr:kinase-like protein [Laetiporus sulphureus 93-53]KZT08399.1 kinase-like protein [Laetiporus sulphureus 93-53]